MVVVVVVVAALDPFYTAVAGKSPGLTAVANSFQIPKQSKKATRHVGDRARNIKSSAQQQLRANRVHSVL